MYRDALNRTLIAYLVLTLLLSVLAYSVGCGVRNEESMMVLFPNEMDTMLPVWSWEDGQSFDEFFKVRYKDPRYNYVEGESHNGMQAHYIVYDNMLVATYVLCRH